MNHSDAPSHIVLKLLSFLANWKTILLSLIGFIFMIYLFQVNTDKMSALAGQEVEMIDMRKNYDLPEIKGFFDIIGAEGREIHRYTTAVIDMIFPFCYGLLFIGLSAFFLIKLAGKNSKWLLISLIPVLLMIVDFIENFKTLGLLKSYPDLSSEAVAQASTITGIKSTLTEISMSLPLILGVIWFIKWVMGKMRK